MAKKQKDDAPNVNATTNRDIIQRLNFLYQASVYLQSIAPAAETLSIAKSNKKQEHHVKEQNEVEMDYVTNAEDTNMPTASVADLKGSAKKARRTVGRKKTSGDLARSYIQCMRAVGQKTTVKIDPSLKRSLCPKCSTTLVPGTSASVRVKKSPCHGHIVVYTCLHCKTTKRIPASPNAPDMDSILPLSTAAFEPQESVSSKSQPPTSIQSPKSRIRNKKKPMPHALPLAARPDAGHIVFRGHERLALDQETGLGVAFA